MVLLILWIEKKYFLEQKRKSEKVKFQKYLKKSQFFKGVSPWFLSKGLAHSFCPKMAVFLTLFLRQ